MHEHVTNYDRVCHIGPSQPYMREHVSFHNEICNKMLAVRKRPLCETTQISTTSTSQCITRMHLAVMRVIHTDLLIT